MNIVLEILKFRLARFQMEPCQISVALSLNSVSRFISGVDMRNNNIYT